MRTFTNRNLIELTNKGYTKLRVLEDKEVSELISECESLHTTYNNDEWINRGVTYPSKGHAKKKSAILMISVDENKELPSTNDIGNVLRDYTSYNNDIISRVTGIKVPQSTRHMINFRQYLGKTEPVFEHFDGEYLKGFIDRKDYHFFDEALLPRFVSLLTLKGGGRCEGAVLVNVVSGEEVNTCVEVGEMVIFNNIKFKHQVPKLIEPRILLGMRTFDYLPYHYILEPKDGYVSLGDKINYGYIKPIGSGEATKLILNKTK